MNALGGDKSSLWHIEFYEDVNGRRPAESWMESLNEIKFAALDAAITHVLEVDGMNLAQTRWLKSLGGGLHEFRIRHTAEQIKRLYVLAGEVGPRHASKILLRVFVHFHGAKVILLIGGYDKGVANSDRHQQQEIAHARKLLAEWRRRAAGLKHD